jgi:HAD superfamily hydrolase (TIGR01490 family)
LSKIRTAAIFDLDSTLVDIDTFPAFLLSALRARPGRLVPASWLPIAYAAYALKMRDNSWLKETFLHAICGGISEQKLRPLTSSFVQRLLKHHVPHGASDSLRLHREAGHRLMLVTASLDIYVTDLASELGFDDVICTQSERGPTGALTGRLLGSNCYGPQKLLRVQQAFAGDRADWEIVAYSDHKTDFPLLEWADVGIAINPTRAHAEIAERAGIPIVDWSLPVPELPNPGR